VHYDLIVVLVGDSSFMIPRCILAKSHANLRSKTMTEPLNRFPLFRTSDPEELYQFSSAQLGASRIELKNLTNFEARVNLVKLKGIGLAFGATSCELSADHGESDFIRVQFAMKGCAITRTSSRETDINQRQSGITPSGVASQMACQAGHRRMNLRLDQDALLRKLEALLGGRPKGKLTFNSAIDMSSPHALRLLQLVNFLSEQLNSDPPMPQVLCRELEQAVQVAFLCASRHSFSELLERGEKAPATSVVRDIEEIIESNWQSAIDIEKLAARAGVSARTLFRAFQQARGYSPMAFAKTVRLKRAREFLMAGDPSVSVTDVALRCNFSNMGHFSKDFHEAFGELPSETLWRSRKHWNFRQVPMKAPMKAPMKSVASRA
jgi:AraC-like DNA-binding protein